MNASKIPLNKNAKHRTSAFALVIALSLMAFVIVLLLTITSFVQVESSASQIKLKTDKARQNALLGLQVAIGDLQKFTGGDRVVTARGNINPNVAHPYWTGVWDVENGGNPTYLVSGEPLNADVALNRSITIVGDESVSQTDEEVRVEKVPVDDPRAPGSYAYYVSDEGIKESVALFEVLDPLANPSSPYVDQSRAKRIQQHASGHTGLGTIFNVDVMGLGDDSAVLSVLSKVNGLSDISFIFDLVNVQLEDRFHDATAMALNTLTTPSATAAGRTLRQDLSLFPNPSDGLSAFLNSYQNVTADAVTPYIKRSPVVSPVVDSPATGVMDFKVAPILSELTMLFNILPNRNQIGPDPLSPTGHSTSLVFRLSFVAELWNPYNIDFDFEGSEGLVLKIKNLPDVNVRFDSNSGVEYNTFPEEVLSLQDVLAAPSDPDGAFVIELPYLTESRPEARWRAGQAVNWAGVNSLGASRGDRISAPEDKNEMVSAPHLLEQGIDVQRLDAQISPNIFPGYDLPVLATRQDTTRGGSLVVEQTSASGPLEIDLYYRDAGGDESFLATYTGPEFQNILAAKGNPFANSAAFGYHFILKEPGGFSTDWLTQTDFRSQNAVDLFEVGIYGDAPSDYTTNGITLSQDGHLVERAGGETSSSANYIEAPSFALLSTFPSLLTVDEVPIFEIPVDPLISMGSLQHVFIEDARPFAFGNSWVPDSSTEPDGSGSNDTYNSWFDRYYLSGLKVADLDTPIDLTRETRFPNPYLVWSRNSLGGSTLRDFYNQDADAFSKNFMIQGGFNVNSTSVEAWKAVLSRNYQNAWDYYNRDSVDAPALKQDVDLSNTFARFGQSAQRNYDVADPVSLVRENSQVYQRGIRSLTDAQIATLAEKIVELIQARGQPFLSLESFLAPQGGTGPSLLEEAIENADINSNWSETAAVVSPIDPNATAYLTPADIMTSLAPFVNVRSDTFKIRAYGESESLSGDIAIAMCEATVIRLPETVSSLDDIENPSLAGFGRRYQVVDFRWITGE